MFTPLPITEAALTDAKNALASLTQQAIRGSETDRNNRNIQAAACLVMLFKISAWVGELAANKPTEEEQIALIELAKFVPVKTDKTPVGELQPPSLKAAMSGTSGEIHLDFGPRERGTNSYIIQHVPGYANEQSQWGFYASTTKSKFDCTSLPAGWHSFRVLCLGSAGVSDPSIVITEFAK